MSKLLKTWIVVGNGIATRTDKAAIAAFRRVGGEDFAEGLKGVEECRKALYGRFRAGEITETAFFDQLAAAHEGAHLERRLLLNWAARAEAIAALLKKAAKDL